MIINKLYRYVFWSSGKFDILDIFHNVEGYFILAV